MLGTGEFLAEPTEMQDREAVVPEPNLFPAHPPAKWTDSHTVNSGYMTANYICIWWDG